MNGVQYVQAVQTVQNVWNHWIKTIDPDSAVEREGISKEGANRSAELTAEAFRSEDNAFCL